MVKIISFVLFMISPLDNMLKHDLTLGLIQGVFEIKSIKFEKLHNYISVRLFVENIKLFAETFLKFYSYKNCPIICLY